MNTDHPLNGIVAEDNARLVGLAHYRAMPSPLRGGNLGFLDDLIVAPQDRGGDAAKLLLGALKSIGKEQKWAKIRWITRDDNYRARSMTKSPQKPIGRCMRWTLIPSAEKSLGTDIFYV